MPFHWFPGLPYNFATLIPVVAILVWGGVALTRGPIGQAIADRIRGRVGNSSEGEIAELRDEVDALREELEQTNERIDFAERMLPGRTNDRVATPV